MMDIIVGFLIDGNDVSLAGVSGLDMGSSRFAVHDCSR
jgi:hypothetical protein